MNNFTSKSSNNCTLMSQINIYHDKTCIIFPPRSTIRTIIYRKRKFKDVKYCFTSKQLQIWWGSWS